MRTSNASACSERGGGRLRVQALGIWGALILTAAVNLAPARADQTLSPPEVAVRNGEITVSASLEGGFPPAIDREILSGVSREFFYYVVLYRVVRGWYDEEKTSRTLRFTVKYDLLTRQFTVVTRRDEEGAEDRVFDTFEEMERWVSILPEVPVAPVRILSRKHSYRVAVKAEMKAGEPPALLKYMLFFVPYSHFSTPWTDSRVFRADGLK